MALTLTPVNLNPAGVGSGAVASRGNAASLKWTLTSITLDGSYVAGGITLTPQQLGMDSFVVAGTVNIRTSVAAASPVNGVLDCTSPTAPKLKLVGATGVAELANAAGSGAIVDVMAYGA